MRIQSRFCPKCQKETLQVHGKIPCPDNPNDDYPVWYCTVCGTFWHEKTIIKQEEV